MTASLAVLLEGLNHSEKIMFNSFTNIGKGNGRIYKTKNKNGQVEYFRAKGFFSGIYHYIFSKRLEAKDLRDFSNLTCVFIGKSKHYTLNKVRVEIFFEKIFRYVVIGNPVFEGISNKKLRLTHRSKYFNNRDQLMNFVADKVLARKKECSVSGQSDEVINQTEFSLMKSLAKLPKEIRGTLPMKVQDAVCSYPQFQKYLLNPR